MSLYNSELYMEDVRYVAGLILPWEKLQHKSVLLSGATGLLGSSLGAMGLTLFEERMVALGKAVMGETQVDANSAILLTSAFRYGIYGSPKTHRLSRAVIASGDSVGKASIRAMISIVFMPYPLMKAHFPVLEKFPVLLPWYWMVRIFDKLKGAIYERIILRGYEGS